MLVGQPNFSAVSADALWQSPVRSGRRRLSPPPSARLNAQLRAAERWLVATGTRDGRWVESPRRLWEAIAVRASHLRGRPLEDVRELLDAELIAAVFRSAVRLDGGSLAPGTIAVWRGALRLLARTGAFGVSFEEAGTVLKRAFRQASVRRGDCHVITVGRSRRPRGYEPPLADVEAVLGLALRPDQGFVGAMVGATMGLSLLHGLRAVSLLAIDGRDGEVQGDVVRLRVREKFVGGKRRYRHLALRPQAVALLRHYVEARNAAVQASGSPLRVGLGVPGPLFRGISGSPWTYERLTSTYREYCRAAGVRPFTPHCLRRVYGSRMVALLGHIDAALAGGWRDPEVLLERYAGAVHHFQPRLWLDEPADDLDDALPGADQAIKEEAHVSTVG